MEVHIVLAKKSKIRTSQFFSKLFFKIKVVFLGISGKAMSAFHTWFIHQWILILCMIHTSMYDYYIFMYDSYMMYGKWT